MQASSAGPDFLSVGMQKTGTGWRYDQLRCHPGIWMPPMKESHYLTRYSARHKDKLERLISKQLETINKKRRRRSVRPFDKGDLEFCRTLLAAPPDDANLSYYEVLFAIKGNQISGDITPAYSALAPARICNCREAISESKGHSRASETPFERVPKPSEARP